MSRFIQYKTSDGTIVGKTITTHYLHAPVDGQDFIEHQGRPEDFNAITFDKHKVDLEKFIVVPK